MGDAGGSDDLAGFDGGIVLAQFKVNGMLNDAAGDVVAAASLFIGTPGKDGREQTGFNVAATDPFDIQLTQSRQHEVIKLLPHVSAIAGAPAGAVMVKPGLGDLDERSAAAFGLLALLRWGLGAWIDARFDPGVQLQGLLAGIGESHGRVGADGEGAACSLPAVVLAPGLGAGARHPEVEAVTVMVLGARPFRVGPQGLDRLVTEHGGQRRNAGAEGDVGGWASQVTV